jgi:hypothetical protein
MIIQKISPRLRRVQTKEIDNLTVRHGACGGGIRHNATMSNDKMEVTITRQEYEKLRAWFEEK